MYRTVRTITATACAVACVGGLATAVSASDAAAAPAPRAAATVPGTYHPVTPTARVLDTRSGAAHNQRGALRAGAVTAPAVAGRAGLPTSGIGSVAVTITVVTPRTDGWLTAWGTTAPARAVTVQYTRAAGTARSAAVVPLRADGHLSVRNNAASGAVNVVVDVTGYYSSGTPGNDPGTYHPLRTTQRLVDTRTGAAGNFKGTVTAQRTITPRFGGALGIPSDAGAVAATVTVLAPGAGGAVLAFRQGDPRTGLGAVHFTAGRATSAFAVLGLGNGLVNLVNSSRGTITLVVDVVGYYSGGVSTTAGTMRPLVGERVLPSASVGAGRTYTLTVGGRAGVPLRGVSAVVATVLYASSAGTRSLTSLLPVAGSDTAAGKITVGNPDPATRTIAIDVHGYVPDTTLALPIARYSRYPNDLTGTDADVDRMRQLGAADAAAGRTFVLLQIGAQSVTPPTLSATRPGVVVALASRRVAIRYPDLVADLAAYLQAYDAGLPAGTSATLAVGTNNDGVFDPKAKNYYSPADRGRDWADAVIDELAAASGKVEVVGADDIEAGFASDQYQALAWEQSYLAATSADLVYNGSADGCPVHFGSKADCAYGWTQAQYVDLASDPGRRIQVLPQIYGRDQATQWANLDAASGGTLLYAGVLTQPNVPDSFAPLQGWAAFVRALSSVRAEVPTLGLRSIAIRPDA